MPEPGVTLGYPDAKATEFGHEPAAGQRHRHLAFTLAPIEVLLMQDSGRDPVAGFVMERGLDKAPHRVTGGGMAMMRLMAMME